MKPSTPKQDLARKRNWCLFILRCIYGHTWVLQQFGIPVTNLRLQINRAELELEKLYLKRKSKLDSVKLDSNRN